MSQDDYSRRNQEMRLEGSFEKSTSSSEKDGSSLIQLALSPKTGWIVTAMWKSLQNDFDLREAIAKVLVMHERDLRDQNIAVWKVCQLHAYKTRTGEWQKKQYNASRKQRIFDSILATTSMCNSNVSDALECPGRKKKKQQSVRHISATKRISPEAAAPDKMTVSTGALLGLGTSGSHLEIPVCSKSSNRETHVETSNFMKVLSMIREGDKAHSPKKKRRKT